MDLATSIPKEITKFNLINIIALLIIIEILTTPEQDKKQK